MKLLGSSKAATPQRLTETIHPDIGPMLFDQPLELVIQHLQTFLTNARHEKLRIVRGHTFGNHQPKLQIEGERSETEEEVHARLERERGYVRSKIERHESEIHSLEEKIRVLQKDIKEEHKKLEKI